MVDCRERVRVADRPNFRSKCERNMLAEKALYILKNSSAAFRAFLAETLDQMGYMPSYDDPDLWLQPSVKPDSFEYY